MPTKKPTTTKTAPKKPARRPRVEEDEVEEEEIEEEEEDVEETFPVDEEEPDEEEDEEEEESPKPKSKKKSSNGTGAERRSFDFKDQMTADDWQKILDQTTNAGGPFFYLKDGKTRLHILAEKGTKTRWFTEVTNTFNGKTRTKVLFLAVLFSGKGITEEMKAKVMPVIAAKAVATQILNLLAEGYNLLSPTKGLGLSISRRGTGLDTQYNVLPSQEPRPLPEGLTWPEGSLSSLADEYESNSADRDEQRVKGKRRRKDEDSEEEEW